jgi:hypothetical protein
MLIFWGTGQSRDCATECCKYSCVLRPLGIAADDRNHYGRSLLPDTEFITQPPSAVVCQVLGNSVKRLEFIACSVSRGIGALFDQVDLYRVP